MIAEAIPPTAGSEIIVTPLQEAQVDPSEPGQFKEHSVTHRNGKLSKFLATVALVGTAIVGVGAMHPAVAEASCCNANSQTAFTFFEDEGYTAIGAAAWVGNLSQESSVDPTAVQPNGVGHGIAQWSEPGRWDNLVAYASDEGQSEWSLNLQLDFMQYELNGAYSSVASEVKATGNLTTATEDICNDYEIAGTCGSDNRVVYAQDALDDYGSEGPGSDGLDNLSFINTDYYDGGAQEVTYTEASGYQSILSNVVTGYPSTTANGSIFPLYKPNGDLSFINTDYYGGHAQDVTYSASSNYQTMVSNVITPYPSTTPNGTIIPLYKPNGDLSFINLNYGGGHVQDVTYSASSGYQSLESNIVTPYPDVPGNGLVIPEYEPNGDLAFINMDYWAGDTQVVSYSAASGYESLASNIETPYPDVTTPGLVVPLFHSNGNLSFININYDGGYAQDVTYNESSGFSTLSSNVITAYPDTAPDDTIFPLYQPNGS